MFERFDLTSDGLKALRARFNSNKTACTRIDSLLGAMQRAPEGRKAVYISFPGFYETMLADDSAVWERWESEEDETTDNLEKVCSLGISREEVLERAWRFYRPNEAWPEIARAYVSMYESGIGMQVLNWIFDGDAPALVLLSTGLEFVRVDSPREYNFQTDACMCLMPSAAFAAVFHIAEACGFWDYWRNTMAPRDGFLPYSDETLLGDNAPFSMTMAATEVLFDYFLNYYYLTAFDETPGDDRYMYHPNYYGEAIYSAVESAYFDAVGSAIDDCAADMIEENEE